MIRSPAPALAELSQALRHLQLAPEVAISTGVVRAVLARLQAGG